MADDEEWDPRAQPSHYFSRIGRALTRAGDARLRAVGLATAQLPVLSMLSGGVPLSQTELARRAGVEQPSMAQLLARMEREGLIEREPDPSDRRSSLISLTQEAKRRLPAGRVVIRQGNVDITRGLSEQDISQLLRLLGRVLDNVDEIEG